MIQFQGQASTPGREEVLQVAELLAAHGREPGAIAAAGWAAAQAEAVTVSAMPGEHIDTAEFVGCMAAVDDDTNAYWQHADADRWQSETPTLVSEAATRIAARSDRAFFTNPADARASWALSVGAAAAARAIAYSNKPLVHDGAATIPAGHADPDLTRLVIRDAVGCRVRTVEGRVLFDLSSGLYNTPLGHRHPAPAVGFLTQATSVAATNPFVATTPVAEHVADRLRRALCLNEWSVVFAGSGSEAMETAMRFAVAVAGRIVNVRPGEFHGITAAAAALSSHHTVHYPLRPIMDVRYTPISDWKERGVGVIEPAGVMSGQPPITEAERSQLSSFRRRGGVVVVDEVLSGLGRTMWPSLTTALRIPADIVVLGKGLANGIVPISAVLIAPEVLARVTGTGGLDHGHTHSNHAASLGAALGCLESLEAHKHDPDRLRAALDAAGVANTTIGWLASVKLTESSRATTTAALLDAGLMCHLPTMVDPVERLIVAPPLTTSDDDLADMAQRLADVQRVLAE